tara:strand:+ start:94 stop:279 length:186 start_codon:yes stop_codon:yes gene_type:complete
MQRFVGKFVAAQEGAVTVDWVVLCAAIIGLGMLVLTPIAFSTDSSASAIADYITGVPVGFD